MVNRRNKYSSAAYFTILTLIILLAGCRSSPVSPSTENTATVRIDYSIPEESHVTLTLCNSYNVKLATLVDSTQNPGEYSVVWDSAEYPAGIYFYRLIVVPLEGGSIMDVTKKLIIK